MNENLNLTKILKDCPKGWKFWSPLFGEVEFVCHWQSMDFFNVRSVDNKAEEWSFTYNATIFFGNIESKEIMLYPSKEQRDWSKFEAPWYKSNISVVKEEKFDPKTLKPFDKVLVRDSCNYMWECDLFSHVSGIISDYRYRCLASCYRYCIPYNNDTKHLLGTFNLPPKYYVYWDIYNMV